ncbi:MAG: alpha/beta fold hydrolase, partial [Myxococcota bacterium]
MKRWRGMKDLVAEAVDATTGLVQSTHDAVRERVVQVADVAGPLAAPTRAVAKLEKATSDLVYASVRATNRAVQATLDVALALEPEVQPGEVEAAALAALNGAVGDHLAERNRDLGFRMSFRREGESLEAAALAALGEGESVCVFVHGLGCSESFWAHEGTSFAERLEADGWRAVFVRYNTGLPVAVNGRELSERLEAVAEAKRLVLIGHSMGGLVARSAVVAGLDEDRAWLEPTSDVICLGTPHHGAPLEKVGNALAGLLEAVDVPATKVIATVINARSLG